MFTTEQVTSAKKMCKMFMRLSNHITVKGHRKKTILKVIYINIFRTATRHTAKSPHGEVSLRRNDITAKCR